MDPIAESPEAPAAQPPAKTFTPPTSLTDLQILISSFSAEKVVYFSPTAKIIGDGLKTMAAPPADLIGLKIRPLRDEEMVACFKLADIDPPKMVPKQAMPGQPAAPALFGEEYDFLDAAYQEKLRAGKRLQRAAIIVGGLVDLQIPGDDLKAKADYLSKNFPTRLLNFLREEIEAISSGEIKALELASFTSSAG